MKLNKKQLQKLILQEMWSMSSDDMLKSGQLEEKLKTDMQQLLSDAVMMGVSINMISDAVSASLNDVMNKRSGESSTYQVSITEIRSDEKDKLGDHSEEYASMIDSFSPYDK